MFLFCTLDGSLYRDGELLGIGYSGHLQGRNAPELDSHPNIGPIPRGEWVIIGPPFNSPSHGPYALRLQPAPDTQTYGRSGFLIHGDSRSAPGFASLGCIILTLRIRQLMWESGERQLLVVGVPPPSATPPEIT